MENIQIVSFTDNRQSAVCLRCGCDLNETGSSKFDANYCIYCQNQNTGKYEGSNYDFMHNYLVSVANIIIADRANKEAMDPKEIEDMVDQLIKENTRIIWASCIS